MLPRLVCARGTIELCRNQSNCLRYGQAGCVDRDSSRWRQEKRKGASGTKLAEAGDRLNLSEPGSLSGGHPMFEILVAAGQFNATHFRPMTGQFRDELARKGGIDTVIACDSEYNVTDTLLHGAAQQFNPKPLT